MNIIWKIIRWLLYLSIYSYGLVCLFVQSSRDTLNCREEQSNHGAGVFWWSRDHMPWP
jgi:hypothetical protein